MPNIDAIGDVSQPSTPLDLALYHAHSWRVFPVWPDRGKRPAVKAWPEQATSDPDVIRELWSGIRANCMVGGLCGPGEYLAVDIDIKGEHDGFASWNRLASDVTIKTRLHETPSGGAHLVFQYPDDSDDYRNLQNAADPRFAGIDIRGWNGFIVLPGSRYVDESGSHTWSVVNDLPISALPEPLKVVLRRPERLYVAPTSSSHTDSANVVQITRAQLAREIEALCAPLRSAPAGSKHGMLYSAALKAGGWAWAGDPEIIATALFTAIEAAATAHGDTGFDPEHTRETIRDGMENGSQVQKTPWQPPRSGGTLLDPSLTVPAVPASLLVRGGAFILDIPNEIPAIWGKDPEVVWSEGESLMIAGQPGVGKTTVAGQLIRARLGLNPVDVLGMPVRPGQRVLYLAMDRPAQAARALRRLFTEADREVLDDRLVVWKGPPPSDVIKNPRVFLELALEAQADTIVVDSMKDAAGDLSASEVAPAYNVARQTVCAAGIQMLELHHTVKRGTNGPPRTLADVYGGMALTAGAGSVVLLYGEAGDSLVEVLHLKSPGEPLGNFKILHDHQAGTSAIYNPRDLYTLIRAAGDHGIATKAIVSAYLEKDSPSEGEVEKVRRKLNRMASEDKIEKLPTPMRTVSGMQAATMWRVRHDRHATVTVGTNRTPAHAVTDLSRNPVNPAHETVTTVTHADRHVSAPPFKGGGTDDDPESEVEVASRTTDIDYEAIGRERRERIMRNDA